MTGTFGQHLFLRSDLSLTYEDRRLGETEKGFLLLFAQLELNFSSFEIDADRRGLIFALNRGGADGWDNDDIAGGIFLLTIAVLIGLWLLDQLEGTIWTNEDRSLVRRGFLHPAELGYDLLHFFL